MPLTEIRYLIKWDMGAVPEYVLNNGWTDQIGKATRFSSKKDAENYIRINSIATRFSSIEPEEIIISDPFIHNPEIRKICLTK